MDVIYGMLTLSPREAAARLGVGRGVVYELVKTGRLPAIRVGRRYRIPVKVLEDALLEPERLSVEPAGR